MARIETDRPFHPVEADADAQSERLRAHGPLLRALALRLTRDDDDADDLVQDTLERALTRGRHIETDRLRAWMVTVLHNLFIDRCRERKRRPRSELDPAQLQAAPPAAPPPAWQKLDARALREAVEKLPSEFREVYRMHAFDGRDYAAIADTLGIAKATVGTRLLRARRRLRGLLTEQASAAEGDRAKRGRS